MKSDGSITGVKRPHKEISKALKSANRIYYMPSREVQQEIQMRYHDEVPVDLEADGVRYFPVRARIDLAAVTAEMNDDFADDAVGSVKLIIDAHGIGTPDDDGKNIGLPGSLDMFSLGNQYAAAIHPSEIFSEIETNDKPAIFDVYGCNVGEEAAGPWEAGVQTYVDDLLDSEDLSNAVVILNSGKNQIYADHAYKGILKTFHQTDPIKLFLLKILHYPETKVYIALSSETLKPAFFKSSAPRPASAEELSDDALRDFLVAQMAEFLAFCAEEMDVPNNDRIMADMTALITPDLLEEYRKDALRVEIGRGKSQYVRHYVEYMRRSGEDMNQVFDPEYGGYTLVEDVRPRDKDTLNILLSAGCRVERAESVMRKSHLLNILRTGEFELELVDLLLGAGANPDFSVRTKEGVQITPRILAERLESTKPGLREIFARHDAARVAAAAPSGVITGGASTEATGASQASGTQRK